MDCTSSKLPRLQISDLVPKTAADLVKGPFLQYSDHRHIHKTWIRTKQHYSYLIPEENKIIDVPFNSHCSLETAGDVPVNHGV